jgi:hypothetical protein
MFGITKEVSGGLKERRMFERFVARLPVKFSESGDNFSADTYMRDVSAAGAKLVVGQPLSLEDKINLWVRVPDGKEPLRLTGQVIWTKESGRNAWDAGIRFSKIRFMDLHRVFSL